MFCRAVEPTGKQYDFNLLKFIIFVLVFYLKTRLRILKILEKIFEIKINYSCVLLRKKN